MTALLRACLQTGDEGRRAWTLAESWIEELSVALKQDLREAKNLVPLLAAAEVRNGVLVDRSVRTLLRTGLVREELRSVVFRRVLGSVLAILGEARVPFALTGGAAAMETAYGQLGPRHTHGIDLLTTPPGVSRAAEALTEAGFQAEHSVATRFRVLRHDTSVPVRLRSVLSPWLHDGFDSTALVRRAEERRIAGERVAVLSPSDALVDSCATAFDPEQREGSLWVCDAWLLLQQRPDLDWTALLALSRESGLSGFVWGALDFLATELQAPVPDHVLTGLEAQATQSASLGRDVVLAQVHGAIGWRGMARAIRSRRLQLPIFLRLLVPSATYMRRTRYVSHTALLPWHYSVRLLRFLYRMVRTRASRGQLGLVQ